MSFLKCDLHIHSALSSCADDDMTPGNIVRMSKIKGLDVIAITDHQSCGNVESAMYFAKNEGIIVVPGMELETCEEIHAVCLFESLSSALKFEEEVRKSMPPIVNREDIFGEQWYFDKYDEKIRKEEYLLTIACSMTFSNAIKKVADLGGICYPAHVNRDSYSILSVFGTIPDEYSGKLLEVSPQCDIDKLIFMHPLLKEYKFIISSDSHSLANILESGSMVEIAQFIDGENPISPIIKALIH